MLKALFLDMDETLCDTHGANSKALQQMEHTLSETYGAAINATQFGQAYIKGVYREWTPADEAKYLPLVQQQGEMAFRVQLITDLLDEQNINANQAFVEALQHSFDENRIAAFDFYEGVEAFLLEARKLFTLVVITNGPEFSQLPKLTAVNMENFVDHIIVGGQEPEQKPAVSIFEKALRLAGCEAHEAIHVGDSLHNDIAGANNSGITSVWIQHQQPLDAELGINPSHTVMHPDEIPALIKQLSA